jgi:hypothetical protein
MKDRNNKISTKGVVPRMRSVALRQSTEDPDRHLIRLQLAKPPHQRTDFLRVPLATGGSCI